MTLKGDDSVPNKFGLALKAKAISVEQGGSLTITDAALNAIKIDDNTVTIQDNAYAANALVSKTGSVVNLDFTSGTSLSNEALTQLRKKLFDLNGKDHLAGTLNVGDAKIAGLPTVGSDGKVEWSDLAANKDVITDTTNNDLMNATVTGVTSAKPIRGSFGAVTSTQATDINNDERLTLNKADQGYFAAQVDAHGNLVKDGEGNVVALGFTVAQDTDLTLNNGGKAGNITLNANSGLVIGGKTDGVTELTNVSGGTGASLELLAGTLQVTNKNKKAEVSVDELSTAAGTTLKADKLTVSSTSEVKGNLDVTTKAEFKGKAKLSGQNTLAAVDFKDNASIVAGKTTVSGDLNVADTKKLSVIGGAALDVKTLKALGTGTEIFVGQSKDEPNGIDSTSGVLAANLFNLNGAYLVIDPEFGEAASFAGADIFGNDAQAEDAGIVHGNIYALQNAIASIGNKDEKEVKAKFAQFLDSKTGSLQKDGVGAIAYVAKNVKINDGSKIVVDPTATDKTYNATANTTEYNKGDLYLGNGAALAVDVSALADSTKAAITFNKTNADAVVYAKDSTKSAIYVTGSLADINKNAIKLFANTASGQKVNLELGNTAGAEKGKLTVQTINGLYAGSLTEGDITSAPVNLAFQTQKAKQTFDVVSAPVQDTLLAAGAGFFDYDVSQSKDKVLGAVAEGITKDGNNFYYGKKEPNESNKLDSTKPADKAILDKLANGTVVDGVVYYAPENELIENILVNGSNPMDAETNARLAVFGGAPQAAIEAGASTYEAISARMGVGVSGVSSAANGQGGAIWVTPVYKSADADGFNADNKSYGADVKLYGLALGADIEVAPNFKVGGMFNVGSGDADGQGLGSNVSNDFDYYGLGLYAGYSMDAFSLVADVTYTAVDNDIEGNTDLGKVTTSIDSTNLSVGVTGQYKLSLAGMDVTPHAGLRYSMIDMDDYSTAYSQNDSDSINIFSLPVGVTIAKEYVSDTWTVKPSFDLTLTGNFGDDEVDATAKWNGYSNLSTTVKSEIMDNFTYGAAVGVSATSGNFGLGLGVNYTGSSNTDEFGVNANARYMF
ncbi:autotransporter outer membrane beta-barrel domain-containing protein [Anaerobiospirillum sp. NML120448]|uniref:autotransporter family protein n=1 Tax=Anaerobiospirillum sp. NML120448 TaxID=2932816 RepID=UPI001FF41093|nr:autotransporter outer membrane beta-barrel domain-containing protein [Anaerobiospirillum sp. NML120448]MCK0515073.1 autotransporter outer membrane beta-barrel domain-containing protein [Anaerobiospirillum sp. NML120448]